MIFFCLVQNLVLGDNEVENKRGKLVVIVTIAEGARISKSIPRRPLGASCRANDKKCSELLKFRGRSELR